MHTLNKDIVRWKTLFIRFLFGYINTPRVCAVCLAFVPWPHSTPTQGTRHERRCKGERKENREKYLYRRIIWKIVSITFNNIIKYDFASTASSSSDASVSHNAWRFHPRSDDNNVFVALAVIFISFSAHSFRTVGEITGASSPLTSSFVGRCQYILLLPTAFVVVVLVLNIITISMHAMTNESVKRDEEKKKDMQRSIPIFIFFFCFMSLCFSYAIFDFPFVLNANSHTQRHIARGLCMSG